MTRQATVAQLWHPITDWLASLPASECWLAAGDQAACAVLEMRRGLFPDSAYLYAKNAATWARMAQERTS